MKIALDVSIQENALVTGVERVQRSLLDALARVGPRHEYLLLSKRPLDLGLDLPDHFGVCPVVPEGSPYLWRERFVAPLLDRRKVDVFHSPVSATPILGRSRKIATVHELPWVERSAVERAAADREGVESAGRTRARRAARRSRASSESVADAGEVVRRGHRVWLFLNVRYASRIVAVSERTRENILALYPDAADRVTVIHHGVDARFRVRDDVPARRSFLARFGIPDKPFLFFVGTLRRKKNLRALVRVFADLPKPERDRYTLVMAGIRNPWPEFEELLQEKATQGRVFLPGYVSDEDLVAFYNHATAVLYPSLFEGFGLPPLEAMACGAPVITSTGGAIPEVVGKAALTFPPEQPDALRDAILSVLREPDRREKLRRAGLKHVQQYRWEDAARRYLDLYEELAGAART